MRVRVRRKTRQRIIFRDLCQCRECGRREPPWWDGWQMGHMLPVAQGGQNWRNLALICAACNQRIGAQVWEPRIHLRWWQVALDWFLVIWLADWPRLADLRGDR